MRSPSSAEIAPDAEAAEELEALNGRRVSGPAASFCCGGSGPRTCRRSSRRDPSLSSAGALDSSKTQIPLRPARHGLSRSHGRPLHVRLLARRRSGVGRQCELLLRVAAEQSERASTRPGTPCAGDAVLQRESWQSRFFPDHLSGHPKRASRHRRAELPARRRHESERRLTENGWLRWEGSVGLRYLNLSEALNINAFSVVDLAEQYKGLGVPFDGNTIVVGDSFDTRNHFYGGQLGTRVELEYKRWTLDLSGKVALGVTHQIAKVHGNTTIDTTPAFAAERRPVRGVEQQRAITNNAFAVVPEVGFTLKFRLTERLQLFGGYSFLYWSRVARPADQVDTTVNPNFVPTARRSVGSEDRSGRRSTSTAPTSSRRPPILDSSFGIRPLAGLCKRRCTLLCYVHRRLRVRRTVQRENLYETIPTDDRAPGRSHGAGANRQPIAARDVAAAGIDDGPGGRAVQSGRRRRRARTTRSSPSSIATARSSACASKAASSAAITGNANVARLRN